MSLNRESTATAPLPQSRTPRKIRFPEEVAPRVAVANYFQPRPGYYWGYRVNLDFEFILVAAGRYSQRTRNNAGEVETTELAPGQVLLIEPGREHQFRDDNAAGDPGRIACVHLEFSHGSFQRGDYEIDIKAPPVTDTFGDPALRNLFQKMARTFRSGDAYRGLLLDTMARELCLRLAARWVEPGGARLSRRLREMIEYVENHAEIKIDRQILARTFHVTPAHVNYLFKKELETSTSAFIHAVKARKAYELLAENGLSVKEVAFRMGYRDESYFSRVFKGAFGIPPVVARTRPRTV